MKATRRKILSAAAAASTLPAIGPFARSAHAPRRSAARPRRYRLIFSSIWCKPGAAVRRM